MSNAPAQALYRVFGFHPAGVRKGYYVETNEDALVMWAEDIDTEAYVERLASIEATIPGTTEIEEGLPGAPPLRSEGDSDANPPEADS